MATPEDIAVEPSATAKSEEPEIAAISLLSRIPSFWRDDVSLWFNQFESVVTSAKISEEQKYHLVIALLEKTELKQVSDILRRPPPKEIKYSTLKNRLISVYEESETRQLQTLLSGLELGDMKPTQLLRKMRDLGESLIPDDALKVLWMNQLPSQIRAVLAVNSESPLDTLASMADKMREQIGTHYVAAIAPSTSIPGKSQIDVLSAQIEKLALEVAELRGRRSSYRRPFRRARSHSRRDSRSRDTSNSSRRRKPGDPDRARRCESPCARRRQEN